MVQHHWRAADKRRSNDTVCPPWLLDAAEDAIGTDDRVSGNPAIRGAYGPIAVIDPYRQWNRMPNALIATQSPLVFATKKGIGKRAAVRTLQRYDFTGYQVGLHNGAGPNFECTAVHGEQGVWRFLFAQQAEASGLGAWFANG